MTDKLEGQTGLVGSDVLRPDAVEKVRGKFPYLADEGRSGILHGAIFYSPIAHGLLESIDVSEALAMPGVSNVFIPDDIPEVRYNGAEWFPGHNDRADERLLNAHARYVGDRVALVLAEDAKTARSAVRKIKAVFRELSPVLDPEKALSDKGLHPEDDGSASIDFTSAYGDIESAFDEAARLVETSSSTPKTHHAAMEPHAVMALPGQYGVIEVRTPCQFVFGVQHIVALTLGLPLSKIRVVKVNMGGTFGGKQEVVYEALCAWAVQKSGRAVRIVSNREESMLSTRSRTASTCKIVSTFDDGGLITARSFDVTLDAGAYFTGTPKVLGAMGKKASRLYRVPALDFRGRSVRTSTVPAGACRGYGSPQLAAHTEIHMDIAARRLGIDPLELRLRNLVRPYDSDPSGGPNLGNARIIDCLVRGAEEFDWSAKKQPYARGRFRVGSGLACATHGNGYYGSKYHDFTAMSLRIFTDGSLVLRGTFHDLGHGTLAAMAQIVGQATGIPFERVTVTEGDSLYGHNDIGCQASRVIYVCGECARKASIALMARLAELTAGLFGLAADDVVIEKESVSIPALGVRLSVAEAVRRIESELNRSVDILYEHRPEANPASFGVNFMTVEVDTLTGLVRVLECLAVHDVGRVINPQSIRGQIYGGIQMGIGMALMEELSYDRNGRPRCSNFDRYHMVSSVDMPDVRVMLIEEFEEGGPYGAKSIGEIATVPAAPAVVNAVNRALGTEMTDLPLTAARIISRIG